MPFSAIDINSETAHRTFSRQAGWTRAARDYVLSQVGVLPGTRLLEVGCGEGVICADLRRSGAAVYGVDVRLKALQFARQLYADSCAWTAGDALALPYPTGCFDGAACHFLLLWLTDPLAGLKEMRRVVRSGGWVAVMAEPDYGGRIDYPPELAAIGEKQSQALARQGADTNMGRKLSGLLHAAGLQQVETALLGGQWRGAPAQVDWQEEWGTITADLGDDLSTAELEHLKARDALAWQTGERVLYVPTFYGWGRVP